MDYPNIVIRNLRRRSVRTVLTILSTAFSIVRDYVSQFPSLALACCVFAYLHAILRSEPEAQQSFERFAVDDFAGILSDWNWIVALSTLPEVCVLLRDERRAAILYDLLHPFGGRNFTMGCADVLCGSLECPQKQLTTLMRRFNEAEAHFERALKFNQQMSASPLEVKTLYKCASMLRLRGLGSDRKRALAILHHALVTAAALKMKDLERRAQPILASVLRPRQTTSIAEHSGDTAAGTTRRAIASVLFTDVVGSTQHVTKVKDRTWAELLGRLHQAQRSTVAEFGGRHVNTAGDGMLALFNHPAEAIRCAFALSTGAAQLGLRIRSGIHTGECEFAAGYVAGIAVHIGARVVAQAGPEDVMVSSTVRDLLAGGEITFVDRGVTTLKGIPDEWRLYSVRGLGSDQC